MASNARGYSLYLWSLLVLVSGWAQTRMSDKDVEDMRKNLNEDAKKLRSSFNSAVGKSTIRKTQQEKDAKALVERFQKQTEGMLDHFKDKKKVDAELSSVRSSADQIDTILTTTQMGDKLQRLESSQV